MKVGYAGYAAACPGAYAKNKKKSVDGQFAAVKYMSETYCWNEKFPASHRRLQCLAEITIFSRLRFAQDNRPAGETFQILWNTPR